MRGSRPWAITVAGRRGALPEPSSIRSTPYPVPRPSAVPNLLYQKLKGGRRRRR
jgi:hypothetical protein